MSGVALNLSEEPTGAEREIILLRTKLEIRTWFLRVSIALNMGVVAGIVVKVLG